MELTIVVEHDTIMKKVKELAKQISHDYNGKDLILIGVLKGAVIFLADIMREITIPVDVDFMSVSSYGNAKHSSGEINITMDIETDITGKNVLIVEDLIDTGLTLLYLKEYLKKKQPESIRICTAFDKVTRRNVDINVEYKGIIIPDEFVVGYGLDYAGKYRNLRNLYLFSSDRFNTTGFQPVSF
jgi:hypoxanthine phosphoribosyltransferase